MKKIFLITTIVILLILSGIFTGIQAAQASFSQNDLEKSPLIIENQSAEEIQKNFQTLEQFLSTWEKQLTSSGWVRLQYQENVIDTTGNFITAEAQYPSHATIEIWFHYNSDHLVDQEIDFFYINESRILTSIIFKGEYRGASENFSAQIQEPYAPSLSFYLTAVNPASSEAEGIRMGVSQDNGLRNNKPVSQFNLSYIYPDGLSEKIGYSKEVTGIMNTATINPENGALLSTQNYFIDHNNTPRLYHEIDGILAETIPVLPEEIQWYFDHYDSLDWKLYTVEIEGLK